jgi:hypothetical protein
LADGDEGFLGGVPDIVNFVVELPEEARNGGGVGEATEELRGAETYQFF